MPPGEPAALRLRGQNPAPGAGMFRCGSQPGAAGASAMGDPSAPLSKLSGPRSEFIQRCWRQQPGSIRRPATRRLSFFRRGPPLRGRKRDRRPRAAQATVRPVVPGTSRRLTSVNGIIPLLGGAALLRRVQGWVAPILSCRVAPTKSPSWEATFLRGRQGGGSLRGWIHKVNIDSVRPLGPEIPQPGGPARSNGVPAFTDPGTICSSCPSTSRTGFPALR